MYNLTMDYIKYIREKVGHSPIFIPAASGFIIKNNQILLQKRSDNHKWAAHGGGMIFGETPLETLTREIKEELGVTPINPSFLNIYAGEECHFTYPNGDEVYAVVSIFLIKDYQGDFSIDPNEIETLEWFDLDKIPPKSEINPADYLPLMDAIKKLKSTNHKELKPLN